MNNRPKDIELRSEKIKNIIGQVPSFLIRCGNSILCIIFLLLIISAVYIPFPYKVDTNIYFETGQKGKQYTTSIIYVPQNIISKLSKAKGIYITLAVYQNEVFIPTRIDSICFDKKIFNQTLYQKVHIIINNSIFEDKEEIRQTDTLLEGKLTLNLSPETFVNRLYK